ncbi:AraC family transcriptional regulator [Pararhodobacter sp. CCB-MM2]|uniref:helix-turn-helix domain-containing protein n=1 Tax=Pararhodobacter sp. CCB-MM2 TaxID=1786003 RepID=UPI00082FD4BE|nr:helix-turn-helix transcriptional regulator [Pararhodobacter sp. CCB-MM2]
MPDRFPAPSPAASRRTTPAIQRIASPLTRAGYGLPAGLAHLAILFTGSAALRSRDGSEGDPVEGRRLLWLPDGEGRELLVGGGTRGLLLALPQLSVAQAMPATPLGDQMRRTLDQNLSLPLEPGEKLSALIEDLAAEQSARAPGEDLAVAHLTSLLLVRLWRLARADLIAHGGAPQGLAERFVLLAAQHGRTHWRVADYARALSVTPDRLGSAVQRATGLSPKGYLMRALFTEACELLANTGMPAGQIAFRLGFADQGYFTRQFTKQVGLSPARYRRRMKAAQDRGDTSYAAWP